ncbi:myotubularin-related protein 9-like isoform X1 [Panonychus citri]|uniref:myotubularin-related protein 9-like isoform X1 n=1 Tax=Panonychus citri TaxID=50023 RepID=UPI0023079AB2|nr:myotubularin-related protein 9-like isoform X1 [Panonychus citri]
MEFTDLIKTHKLENVILHRPFWEPIECALCITSHQLLVSSRKIDGDELWLLHSIVDVVERKATPTGGSITLKCKDFRIIQLDIRGNEEFNNVANSIDCLSNIDDPRLLFPFYYPCNFEIVEDGWDAFQIEKEFSKIMMYSDAWRISYVNKNFTVCPSYPEAVIVPKSINDETIIGIASFRCLGRFPVLSYLHKSNKAVILRSGQPMVGTSSKRCKEDEKLINTVLGSQKRGYIIETRTQNLAQLARSKGGGFEPEVHYPLWRRVHKPIDRHSSLLDSLSKLVELCNETSCSMDKFLSRLESCGWLSHIKDVLMCACLVAQCIDQEEASVLVHGAEGMDSTLQVCSLAQVILDPDCRTVHGFEALIEREWIQSGHPFATRCKHGAYTIPSSRTREQSPIFLVFLDCVYQIYHQFPCSFEFNEKFLIMLFEHAYASPFGTFLENCLKQRKALEISKKTVSLWSYINRPDKICDYLNPAYEPNNSVIWPSVAPQSIVLWEAMYLRWSIPQGYRDEMYTAISQLKDYEKEMKTKAAKLRTQLLQLAIANR